MKTVDKYSRWKKTRAKGTLHFIIFGGLYFGISFVALFSLAQYIVPTFDADLKLEHFFEPYSFIKFVARSLVIGFIWSTTLWIWMEFSYQKHFGSKNFRLWIPKQTNNLK